jgi:protein phosphatase
VAIVGTELWLGHVGDSRAYLQARGELRQISSDHSLAAELERSGGGAAEVARVKNILTRCLGAEPTVNVDVSESAIALEDGMQIVMCSDGLSNLVEDGEILHQVSMHMPEGACRRLVDLAKERGAPDNVTVLVARVSRA